MQIEVNNGGTLDIELVPERSGLRVTSRSSTGELERRDFFGEGELVIMFDLLRYMRDYGMKSAYLLSEEMQKYLENLLRNGDIEEYRIFQ